VDQLSQIEQIDKSYYMYVIIAKAPVDDAFFPSFFMKEASPLKM